MVARDALGGEFFDFARKNSLAERVNSGKLSVLFLEQKPELLKRIGIKAAPVYSRKAFASALPLPEGLSSGDFSDWRGDGTHAPDKPEPKISPERENEVPSPFWHWKNLNTVSAYPIQRPELGDYKISLVCGMDLAYSPLFFISSGRGEIAFCQLEASGRQSEPAARRIVSAAVSALSKMRQKSATPKFIGAGNLAPERLAAEVSAGANAVIENPDEKTLAAFGISLGQAQKISAFGIEKAGEKYWGALTSRDTFFRVPQEVRTLEGGGLVPLTTPAFAAEKRLGAGKVVFLNFPKNPLKEEMELGKKLGKNSSHAWSALALRNRLLQMKNLAEAKCGKSFPRLADRLENPDAAPDGSPHFPYAADPFGLYDTESHIRW